MTLTHLIPPPYRNPTRATRAELWMGEAPWPPTPRTSRKRKEGIRYEISVHQEFYSRYGNLYLPSQWFLFYDPRGRRRFCQPDGLLFLPSGKLIVLEIKLSHTLTAYYQILNLYFPVLKTLFPKWTLIPCEVVRWFDPSTLFPVQPKLCADPLHAVKDAFNVHIWSP